MAGLGKRMRPHTLTIPKPLIPLAGKPIVQHLVEEISKVVNEKISEIAFIIGNFGTDVEEHLKRIAIAVGAEPKIYYQQEALGTAHAIYCAAPSLDDKTIVAFADTLFIADFKLDTNSDGIIWVQKVDNPSSFGVVKVDNKNIITDFIEKPKQFVSDLAIIGIYYFKDGVNLKNELKYLLDNNVVVNGEYQLTDALENMKQKGVKFNVGQVNQWLDCGNKDATVNTNKQMLKYLGGNVNIRKAHLKNAVVIEPCFIAENVTIENSVVGPYVSVGQNTEIKNSVVGNCIIQNNSTLINANIANSMIGNFVSIKNEPLDASIGDFTVLNK